MDRRNFLVASMLGLLCTQCSAYSISQHMTTYNPPYIYGGPKIDYGVSCPIPQDCRVFNKTGIQCVWASLETVGRWANEPKLIDLTERGECKSYAGPGNVRNVLNKLQIRFEQATNRIDSLKLVEKAMNDGRACTFGVPGHMMTLVHYDIEQNRACWIDNSDRSRSIQSSSIEQFNRRWDNWVVVVYPDNDEFPKKIFRNKYCAVRFEY